MPIRCVFQHTRPPTACSRRTRLRTDCGSVPLYCTRLNKCTNAVDSARQDVQMSDIASRILVGYARVHESRVLPSRLRSPCEDLLRPTMPTDGDTTCVLTGTSCRSSELGSLTLMRVVTSESVLANSPQTPLPWLHMARRPMECTYGAPSAPRLLVHAACLQEVPFAALSQLFVVSTFTPLHADRD